MSTLVYFASGCYRQEYQKLNFDKIYLIDNCFKRRQQKEPSLINKGKVTCIGMDSFQSVKFLKEENVKIDCFVSLNEGLYEGGGKYAINSDMFLGYVMPLLKDKYIHIMNKNYYNNMHNVSMDLPFEIEEITETDNRYLDPFIFSKDNYHYGHAKVYQMCRVQDNQTIELNSGIRLIISHNSIWNYYDNLDRVVISIKQQGQRDFFSTLPKAINLHQTTIEEIFSYCNTNKINTIGFTPWTGGHYRHFIEKIKHYKAEFPKEIFLFHLNKNDYKEIKDMLVTKAIHNKDFDGKLKANKS